MDHQLKVHIDSNLIKSTSTVPDELKDLGVSVYNENEFEKGVLLQVDIQLAEYELNKIKDRMKKIGVDEDEDATSNDNDQINSEDKKADDEIFNVKKRKTDKYLDTIEQYKEKKSRLESKFEDYRNYLKNDNQNEDSINSNASNSSIDSENLIKTGEMTPFGNRIDFDKPTTSKAVLTPGTKQTKLTDFEAFLLESDKKTEKPKQKKVILDKKSKSDIQTSAPSTSKSSSEQTDFEKFFAELDNEPRKPSKFSKPIASKTQKEATAKPVKEKKAQYISTVDTDFDKLLRETEEKGKEKKLANQTSAKKLVASLNKSKSEKIETKKQKRVTNEAPNRNEPRSEVISFIKAIEEDEDDTTTKNEVENVAEIAISRIKRRVESKKKTVESDDEDLDIEMTDDKDYTPEGEDDDDDLYAKSDEDYVAEDDDDEDDASLSNDESSAEYDTDSDDDSKKKNLRKCDDDGDENKFLKRLKKLEKLEKESRLDIEDQFAELDGGFKVPIKLWNKLYKFQKTGVKWLWELHSQRCGGILGDEMGLGKTVQMITFLAGMKYSKIRDFELNYIGLGPTLIIAPTTLISQWVDEFHDWWPYFRVAVLHDIGTFAETPKHKLINKIFKCNGVLITTYSSLLIYEEFLLGYKWHYVILDEGHKIRNPDTKITIVSKCFRTPHRIILSGSPIQNNLKELWSLFDFIFPGKLGTLPSFMENFSVPIVQGGYTNATNVQVQTAFKCATMLKDTITPYLLRRNKSDVQISIQLPEKNEQVLFCRLSDEQKEHYLRYLKSSDCIEVLTKKSSMFRALMYLRKLCNHVDLCTPAYFDTKETSEKYKFGYFKRSGKMIVVETLLKLWKKQNNRVLLFTQSRKMLDLFEEYVKEQKYGYLKMDGTTPVSTRNRYVKEFNSNEEIFIFILTTKVGGLGLNLIGANRVIIFDPDWNPSTDMQARERSWRIGQTKNVTIYRLLTAGTIEEKIYHRQIFKQFLTNKVLKDPKQKRFFKTNDLYELFSYGSLDENSTIESSALFAGTNSEVKKPKIKYSKMDGERIPGLMKKYDNKTVAEEEQQKDDTNDKQKDDYVLTKLFKSRKRNGGKATIQTAIQHDLIVNNTEPDFALVESEAERVASEAIKALKQSRRLCHSAESGIPNLTGLKFGTKSKFLPFSFDKNKTNNESDNDDDGWNSGNKDTGPLSSASLIELIQARNNIVCSDVGNNETNGSVEEKFTKLADEIRTYISYGASKLGEASTEEITEHFKQKLEKTSTTKFKSILKKMCDFHRTAIGVGFWKLKDEFKSF